MAATSEARNGITRRTGVVANDFQVHEAGRNMERSQTPPERMSVSYHPDHIHVSHNSLSKRLLYRNRVEEQHANHASIAFVAIFIIVGYRQVSKRVATRGSPGDVRAYRLFIISVFWILSGIAFFMYVKGKTFLRALCLIVLIITTVGLGDIDPGIDTDAEKIAMSLFVIVGILVIAEAVMTIVANANEAYSARLDAALEGAAMAETLVERFDIEPFSDFSAK